MEGTNLSPIVRLFQAIDRLDLIGDERRLDSLIVTVTNSKHITIGIRSDKALKVITEALEAAAE